MARARKSRGNVVKGEDGEEGAAQPMKGFDKGIWTLSKEELTLGFQSFPGGTIKDRNCMDLREAKDIKQRW